MEQHYATLGITMAPWSLNTRLGYIYVCWICFDALETVPFVAGDKPIDIFKIEDLIVHHHMVFEDGDQESGVHVRTVVASINLGDSDSMTGNFTYEACSRDQTAFHIVAGAKLIVAAGDPSPQLLPASGSQEQYMCDET